MIPIIGHQMRRENEEDDDPFIDSKEVLEENAFSTPITFKSTFGRTVARSVSRSRSRSTKRNLTSPEAESDKQKKSLKSSLPQRKKDETKH